MIGVTARPIWRRKVTPNVSPLPFLKRATEPSPAIRHFYNESLFTGLSMWYLCWPILRRRASNWNFPKRDSAPSQPLALAWFFALDLRLFNPLLESHRDGSFRSARESPRSLAKFIRVSAYVHIHLSTYPCVCRFAPGRIGKFWPFYPQQSEVRNIDEQRGWDKYE